jgi:hypothetical protein
LHPNCGKEFFANLGATTNLNKHISKIHLKTKEWYDMYTFYNGFSKSVQLDDFSFNLVKYFISSNAGICELENPHLRKILSHSPPGEFAFDNLLKDVDTKLKSLIEIKLKNAEAISLIMDIWTSSTNKDFISLAAVTINNCLQRDVYIISHCRMENSHEAEYLKECVEKMINSYTFDKSKIYAIVLDGARNMIRLASQQNSSFLSETASLESVNEAISEELLETPYFDVDIEPSDVNEELIELTKEINEMNFNIEIETAQLIESSTIQVENTNAQFDLVQSKYALF